MSVIPSPLRFSRLRSAALGFVPLLGVALALVAGACHERGNNNEQQAQGGSRPAPSSLPSVPGRIEVSENGFAPSRVIVENAEPLVFRRTTDKSCATAVIFPQYRIEEPLPLNQDVAIVLPPTASGEVAFQCGVGQYRGKVVASVAGG